MSNWQYSMRLSKWVTQFTRRTKTHFIVILALNQICWERRDLGFAFKNNKKAITKSLVFSEFLVNLQTDLASLKMFHLNLHRKNSTFLIKHRTLVMISKACFSFQSLASNIYIWFCFWCVLCFWNRRGHH